MKEVQIFEFFNGLLEVGTFDLPNVPTVGAVVEIPTDDGDQVLVTVISVETAPQSGSDYAIIIQYI